MTDTRPALRNKSYRVKPGSNVPFVIDGATITYEKRDGYSYRVKIGDSLYRSSPDDLTVYASNGQHAVNQHDGTTESRSFAKQILGIDQHVLTVQHIGNCTLLIHLDRCANPEAVLQSVVLMMLRKSARSESAN